MAIGPGIDLVWEEVMRLLIDGYNYLHAVGLLRARAEAGGHPGPHELERARQALLGELENTYRQEVEITVVFDAANAPRGVAREDWHGGVHVYYELRRKADDLIEELIRHDSGPRTLAVVSDDHQIRQAAARRGCTVLDCQQLEARMQRHRRERQSAQRERPEKPDVMSEREKAELERAFGDGLADSRSPEWPDFGDR
jgi:predicted RNA-binding protein with PIN domain